MHTLILIFTLALVCVSLFLVLVVLAQKTKDGGMGAALGGGATESAFGHETGNVLTKATINAAILFFVLSFALYLGRIYERKQARTSGGNALPAIAVPAVMPTPTSAAPLTPTDPATTNGAASGVTFGTPAAPTGATSASAATPTTSATPAAADAPKPAPNP